MPRVNLCAAASGFASRVLGSVRFTLFADIPMGASRTRPQAGAVGSRTCAGFSAPSASVTSAGSGGRSEEHTSELQSLMRISYAVFCLKKKKLQKKRSKTTLLGQKQRDVRKPDDGS